MRVLFVTHRFPDQSTRGDQLRARQQLHHLGARHDITLLSAPPTAPESAAATQVRAACRDIVTVHQSLAPQAARVVWALFQGRPLQVAMYDDAKFKAALRELLATQHFDLVHLQLSRLGPLLDAVGDTPCVIDFVDSLARNMANRAAFDRSPMRWIAAIEARRLAIYESALAARATRAVVSAIDDAKALGAQVQCIGNGVDPARFPFVDGRPDRDRIVFVGNLGYFPNLDAARWLMREVMPRLRTLRPAVSLQLVGARPPLSLRREAARCGGVELIGPVPDVHPYLAAAAVALAPLRAGSGQQMKMLEAMAAGTPVLASTRSASALDAATRACVRVADAADAYAQAVVDLLADPEAAATLAHNAREAVITRHTWAQSAEALDQVWQSARRI